MAKLTGTNPDQVPTNADLGDMAYKDGENLQAGPLTITDGKVGIGTQSPDELLHIVGGGAGVKKAIIENTSSGQAGLDLKNNAGHIRMIADNGGWRVYDQNDGANRIVIDTNGNVGIGTSSPAANRALHVSSTAQNQARFERTGSATSQIEFEDSTTTNQPSLGGVGDDLTFRTAFTERMRITSSGSVGIGTSSPDLVGSTTSLTIDHTGGNGQLSLMGNGTVYGRIFADNATGDLKMGNPTSNDVMFYTANLERMRISSAGKVGIGNASPQRELHIGAADNTNHEAVIVLNNGGATGYRAGLEWRYEGNTTPRARIGVNASNQILEFDTAGSERMRIDSSGNLLVGMTSVSGSTVGAGVLASGLIYNTRDSGHALQVNRNTSDGDIVQFRKDGSTVGSIGVDSGYLTIGDSDTRLLFLDATSTLIPRKANNVTSNGLISLGDTGSRFKDLYLSGGVYLGGTGSANKLDDYEEGTFNPFSGVGSAYSNTSVRNAKYTKIGRMVSVDVRVGWTGTDGSGNDVSLRLPFTSGAATGTATSMTGAVFYEGSQLFSGAAIVTHISSSSNSFSFYRTSGSTFTSVSRSSTNGTYDFVCSFVYYVP